MNNLEFTKALAEFDYTIKIMARSYKIHPLYWEDIAQELRLNLWKNRDMFIDAGDSFNNWAFICCKNQLIKLAEFYKVEKRNSFYDISFEDLKNRLDK